MIEEMNLCKKEDFQHFIRHFTNGVSHMLILWIISKEKIHGYGIMKTLDKFFESSIKNELVKKTSASKIYPILNRFEKAELIKGSWQEHNNKQVKYYEITEKGNKLLDFIREKNEKIYANDSWKEFFIDMHKPKGGFQ